VNFILTVRWQANTPYIVEGRKWWTITVKLNTCDYWRALSSSKIFYSSLNSVRIIAQCFFTNEMSYLEVHVEQQRWSLFWRRKNMLTKLHANTLNYIFVFQMYWIKTWLWKCNIILGYNMCDLHVAKSFNVFFNQCFEIRRISNNFGCCEDNLVTYFFCIKPCSLVQSEMSLQNTPTKKIILLSRSTIFLIKQRRYDRNLNKSI
jgi:hypothetical protein